MPGFGLRLARQQGMEGYSGNLTEFWIDPTNTAPIFTGDPVVLNGGFIEEASGAADNDDFDILGVFAGCHFTDVDGSKRFRQYWDGGAGRSNIRASIILPGGQLFYIKGRAGTTYVAATAIGARFGIDYTAGSTVYGDSRITLGAAAAPVTGPLVVHRVVDLPGNVIGGVQPVFEVAIIRQQLTAAGLGAGFGS